MKGIFSIIDKVLDLFNKKTKDATKDQELKIQKIKKFNNIIGMITVIVLFTCILNSIFPLKIDTWIYDLLDKLLIYILE